MALDDFYVIPLLLEAGGNVFIDYSVLPKDMSGWRGGSEHDVFNATSGFYNMTLPAVPSPGIDYLLFFIANNSEYGTFQNITLTFAQNDVHDFNVTLYPMAGNVVANISQENETMELSTIETLQVNFSIVNASGSPMQGSAFVETELDYSGFGG